MVVGAENYCMVCKKIISTCDVHECQIKRQTLADSILFGVVDSLYNLGLEPVMAIYSVNSVGTASDVYNPSIIIQLSTQIKYKILGELPAGWTYGWKDGKVFSLDFNDGQSYTDVEDAMTRINTVIKEFEAYLDTRDVESTRAVLLLTTA
jgi:hypothetical protein